MDLFSMNMKNNLNKIAPLAERLRPNNLDEFIGQNQLIGKGKYLNRIIKADKLTSTIFYGPPGIGKTTLARIIANNTNKKFIEISAITSSIKELREILTKAENDLKFENIRSVLFIDEIHRFNKIQQDALLSVVEKGILVLIGATTENPYFEINKALISRCQILNLCSLTKDNLNDLLNRALNSTNGFGDLNINISDDARDFLIMSSNGDGRYLLNSLEIAVLSTDEVDDTINIDLDTIKNCLQTRTFRYDKTGNDHYDTISAFIKSMRGTDPDAALYYLAKMLESGEEPKFIARRLVIFASEDISNADPMALLIATAAFEAVNIIGMPECKLNLAQAVTYLACAPKSNASYIGIKEAIKDVKEGIIGTIPQYLKDKHSPDMKNLKINYKYPHNFENNYIEQQYLPDEFIDKKYYNPTENGYEAKLKLRLKNFKK